MKKIDSQKTGENTNSNQLYNKSITKDDLQALHKKGLGIDNGDDRLLQMRSERIDFSGKALDVPRRDNNLTPSNGINDEGNTLSAQGGKRNENLEAPERANSHKNYFSNKKP